MFTILAESVYLPPQASTVAREVDGLFNAILIITAIFCALIFAMTIYFAVKYRHRPGHEGGASPGHSTALELSWTIVPTIIVLVIFYYGFKGYLDMEVVPPNAYEIQVDSFMWGWGFEYPNGYVDSQLHIPKDRPIRLVLKSKDVIHSLYIPAFRVQKMAVPQRYNRFWVQATQLGEFPLYCAQYCGTNHSEMISKVVVHEPSNFNRWLEEASNPEKQTGFTPASAGEQIVKKGRGCLTCHSIDGTTSTGPTLKDLFGRTEALADGSTITVDENYIRDSLLYPQKQLVKGFQPVMPTFLGMKDREIDWIIAYLKTISSHYKGGELPPTQASAAAPATAPATQPVR